MLILVQVQFLVRVLVRTLALVLRLDRAQLLRKRLAHK